MKVSNYTIFVVTLTILIVVVITATTINLTENHEDKQIYAMQSKVEYYAKRCYLEGKCSGEVSLNKLYELKYINDQVVNPVTKEVIDSNLKINFVDNKVVINWP